MNRLAKAISTFLHPVFVPFMACYLLLSSTIIYIANDEILNLALQSIFIISVAIPLLSVFILKWSGAVSSIRVPNVKERKIPYLITFLSYLFLGLFFRPIVYFPLEFSILFISSALSILFLLLLIPFTKASAHMACFGGLTGALLVLNLGYHYDTSDYIPIVIIISGIVGWSRLTLKAHTQEQLLIGFSLGLASQFIGHILYR